MLFLLIVSSSLFQVKKKTYSLIKMNEKQVMNSDQK